MGMIVSGTGVGIFKGAIGDDVKVFSSIVPLIGFLFETVCGFMLKFNLCRGHLGF